MTMQNLRALKNIEGKFMELLRGLREKIERLEKEKAGLLAEIESLKEKGEAKAQGLESEVTTLRKEVKALEKLLDITEKTK